MRGVGSKPLVFVAVNSIGATSVDREIDVSSKRSPESAGAGPDPRACPFVFAGNSKGGGAGGSFAGIGGAGGDGTTTSSGGQPIAITAPVSTLRGGCPGEDGIGSPGSGGHGGGAVYLIAGARIDFAGFIEAGGEGGASGIGGGGGGGAGGMIGLDAPMISIDYSSAANGGAGGQGGNQAGVAGMNGKDAFGPGSAPATDGFGSGGNGGASSSMVAAGAGLIKAHRRHHRARNAATPTRGEANEGGGPERVTTTAPVAPHRRWGIPPPSALTREVRDPSAGAPTLVQRSRACSRSARPPPRTPRATPPCAPARS